MKMAPIRLAQVLDIMDYHDSQGKPIPFDLVYVADDGHIVRLKNVILAKNRKDLPLQMRRSYATGATLDSVSGGRGKSKRRLDTMIKVLYTGGTPPFRNVHIRTITECNGREIIY